MDTCKWRTQYAQAWVSECMYMACTVCTGLGEWVNVQYTQDCVSGCMYVACILYAGFGEWVHVGLHHGYMAVRR